MNKTKINQNQSNKNTVLFNTLIGNTQSAHVSSAPPTKLSFHQNNSLYNMIYFNHLYLFLIKLNFSCFILGEDVRVQKQIPSFGREIRPRSLREKAFVE